MSRLNLFISAVSAKTDRSQSVGHGVTRTIVTSQLSVSSPPIATVFYRAFHFNYPTNVS